MNKKFVSFKKAVDKEVKKAEKNYQRTKKDAHEIAVSAQHSPSQSGDRFHSQGTADIAKSKLDEVLSLQKEVREKDEKVCFEYDGEIVFVVDNPVMISDFKLVSSKSPLGKEILSR